MDVDVDNYHDSAEDLTLPSWSPATIRFGSYTPSSSSNTDSYGMKRSRVMFADSEPPEERPPKRLRFVSPCN